MSVHIKWHHGGKLKDEGGSKKYVGGIQEVEKIIDMDKISRLDLLWTVREVFKYVVCDPLYYQHRGTREFIEIIHDGVVMDMLDGVNNGESVDVYVDYIDGSHQADVEENRATLEEVANMVISIHSNAFNTHLPINDLAEDEEAIQDEGNGDEEDASYASLDEENQSGHSNDENCDGSDSATTEDELYEADIDDDEGSENDEEVEQVKQTVSSYRRERSKRNKGLQNKEIELREAGSDIGFLDWLKEGNRYAGLLGGDEDYIGSSDVDIFGTEDEDGDGIQERTRKRNTRVHYDPKCEETLWELGMVFENVHQFREAICNYAVRKGVQLTIRPNDSDRVRARCIKTCEWHLFGSLEKRSHNFTIKTYHPVHTCYRTNINRHCNAKFLTKYFKEKVTENPGIKIWQLQDLVKTKLEIYAGKTSCRKAKNNIIGELMGDYRLEFARLYDYRDEILRSNPGSTCVVHVDSKGIPPTLIFRGFYMCFNALKKGFKEGCRRCIGLDGNFLKGICKGQMLVAVTKDGNNQMYPIAWAVTDSETKHTWKWFIKLLQADLELSLGDGYTVVTDMQKGLIPAIKEVLPNAEHRMCARHVLANWSKKWRGVERRACFWRCSKSTFEAEFNDNLAALSKLGQNIVEELLCYDKEGWCRTYFSMATNCDFVDNNMSETFNGWILKARHKTIITLFEEVRLQMMNRIVDMREFVEKKWIADISPMAMYVLKKNTSRAMKCSITWNGEFGFEVVEGAYRHVVDLKKQSCSCRAWGLKGIPCAHAIVALHRQGLDAQNFVAH
ncbi:uncharacterized protein [Euphorbia lathyris]|uniref:uncharacterized protein n=1 Tax=Euphorbia lathyris TaxID=212925 RepID=UPI0033141C3F